MAEHDGGFTWRDAATAAIAIIAPLATGALWVIRDADIERFEERCAIVSRELADIRSTDAALQAKIDGALLSLSIASTKLDSHNTEAERWKQAIAENQRTIADLRTRAGARPDPYTGTDARRRAEAVDTELRNLDRRLDALEVEVTGRANGNGVTKR